MTLAPGTRLGPYEIVELLGEGGMGVVCRARDRRLDRQVAIKVLTKDLTAHPPPRGRGRGRTRSSFHLQGLRDRRARRRALRGDECIPRQTLHRRMLDDRMPLSETLRGAGEIAEALQEAHAHWQLGPAAGGSFGMDAQGKQRSRLSAAASSTIQGFAVP